MRLSIPFLISIALIFQDEVSAQFEVYYHNDSIRIERNDLSISIESRYDMYGEFLLESPICIMDIEQEFIFLYNPRYALQKIKLSTLELVESVYFKYKGKERDVELHISEKYLLLESSDRIALFDMNLRLINDYLPCVKEDSDLYGLHPLKDWICDMNYRGIKIELEFYNSDFEDRFYRESFYYKYPK